MSDDKIFQVTERSIEERMRDFAALLNKIDTLDNKKKRLWREIYDNAIADRHNAFIMFKQLSEIVENKSSEHAIHGRSIASFLERMNKANDQLIKLAELIAKVDDVGAGIDKDEMYSELERGRANK